MSKHNNPPAFPCTPENVERINGTGGSGMTLRDYFAAKAMQGIITSEPIGPMKRTIAVVAAKAYVMADAMLAEREKQNG